MYKAMCTDRKQNTCNQINGWTPGPKRSILLGTKHHQYCLAQSDEAQRSAKATPLHTAHRNGKPKTMEMPSISPKVHRWVHIPVGSHPYSVRRRGRPQNQLPISEQPGLEMAVPNLWGNESFNLFEIAQQFASPDLEAKGATGNPSHLLEAPSKSEASWQ